ncbi:tetratricopeptide repeat protein [Sphingobium sp.]|uniref:tetratricopeptide repeat protein n=1 Tax=Sphingobium sp. TaxID=1912891 RepID=UPI0035C735E3
MAGKDDLGLSLPDPPPPAPARREAAIEAALARFDGEPHAAHIAAPRRWRPVMQRHYLGTALALSLLALIVAPVTWMEMPRREASLPLRSIANPPGSRPQADVMAVPAPPVDVQQEPPTVEAERSPQQAVSAPPAIAQAPASSPPPPPPAQKASEPAPPPPVEHAMTAPPAAAPPPPAPAMAANAGIAAKRSRMAGESEDAREIVVTSARIDPTLLRGRGDWNACTVQDPKRDVALCKKLIDPHARGDRASVNAHMADGLVHAWQGDWGGAIAAFDKAVEVAPKSAEAYLNRGLAYQAQGDDDRALADLDRAVHYAPNAARGYYHRSLLQKQRGDDGRADADRDRAAQLDSRYEP